MLKDQIQELLDQGYSKTEAAKILGITRFKLYYHISEGFKNYIKKHVRKNYNTIEQSRDKLNKGIYNKVYGFQFTLRKIELAKLMNCKNFQESISKKVNSFARKEKVKMFTKEDLLNKIGPEPKCYLTGDPIDLTKTRSYELDHIIPASRGGTNNLDNAGLCTKEANRAKQNMTPDEFINLCKKVLEHNGYQVSKI